MTMLARAKAAAERRLARIEAVLRGIEGVRVERRPGRVSAAGRGLRRRRLEDARLRFLGSGR